MYVEVEYCQGCASHAWCTNHDESKYLGLFQQIQQALVPLPVQVVAAEHPRMGAFEVRFRSSRGSLLLASKLRSGKWPSVLSLYRKLAQLLTSAEWTISVLARRNEVLGLDITSSFPFVVKAVLPDSLGALYGATAGDQLISIGNEDVEISDLPNIRVVLAALKTRPVVARFRRVAEILCPRLEAPIDPPAFSVAPATAPAPVDAVVVAAEDEHCKKKKASPVPPLALKKPPPAAIATPTHTLRTPPALATPAAPKFPEEEGPRTPRATPREEEDPKEFVKATEGEDYADDFDH